MLFFRNIFGNLWVNEICLWGKKKGVLRAKLDSNMSGISWRRFEAYSFELNLFLT